MTQLNKNATKCLPLKLIAHVINVTTGAHFQSYVVEYSKTAGRSDDRLLTGFVFSLGVSGRWKQMVRSLLPSRPALHLCHSLLRRTGSSPTPPMCSSHPQASCLAPTSTCLESASLRASWEGYERCPEGLDHNSVRASSKRVVLSQHRGCARVITIHRKKPRKNKNVARMMKYCHSGVQKSKQKILQTTAD